VLEEFGEVERDFEEDEGVVNTPDVKYLNVKVLVPLRIRFFVGMIRVFYVSSNDYYERRNFILFHDK